MTQIEQLSPAATLDPQVISLRKVAGIGAGDRHARDAQSSIPSVGQSNGLSRTGGANRKTTQGQTGRGKTGSG